MGVVYRAHDLELGRDVAIKILHDRYPANGPDARQFVEEGQITAQLQHPGVPPIHEIGAFPDGRPFLVMKLIKGHTLDMLLAENTARSRLVAVFEQLCATVTYAHERGVLHRDLKPSNVMVGAVGEVLVLDWGVAKILTSPPSSTDAEADAPARPGAGTASGTRIGTAGFMAPEQHRGEASAAGPAADVFSLGAMLFWLLTGTTAPADSEAGARALAEVSDAPPRRLRAIVMKCLAAEPGGRYASAADLLTDLARYRAGDSVVAHRESRLERLARWLGRYRTFILLVVAYLVMRALFAWFQRGQV
jgi:serine/threonine protein kinase